MEFEPDAHVVADADVQRAVFLAREDVDEVAHRLVTRSSSSPGHSQRWLWAPAFAGATFDSWILERIKNTLASL